MLSFVIIVQRLIHIYNILIAVYVLLTWIPGALQSGLGRFLARLVEPYLNIFEQFIPPIFGISFSPMFAILLLELASQGLMVLV
ncbi:MAG: YggT family protein [Aerococcus sp.]|nr:YggT family protein [Aerococcus sp.]